ncbi:MAG TPA: hypothetical protein PKY10_04680 [Lentisphaeria bacterium]|nr:hypothetical protein [Lentisphaeria bacterium]
MNNDRAIPSLQEPLQQSMRPIRAAKLAQRAAATLLGIACALLLPGCELIYPPPIPELQAERARLQAEERKLRNDLHQAQIDLDYYREKSQILEQEKRANEDYLVSSRGNIRSIFNKIRRALDDTGDLYDGFIGDEIIERNRHDTDNLPGDFLLVDLGNPAPSDMTLVAASLYCHSPATVTFYTVRNVTDLEGQYEILAEGQELAVTEPGKNFLHFTGRHALRIKKGEFVAAFFKQGAQVSFDDAGTGDTIAVIMDKPEKNKRFSRQDDSMADVQDASGLRRSRAYSFRLWGFKPEETATAAQ